MAPGTAATRRPPDFPDAPNPTLMELMERYAWILLLAMPLALPGCMSLDDINPFDDDEPAAAQTPTDQFVTVNINNNVGIRIKDPLGNRPTGATCGKWDNPGKGTKGVCCWNERGECECSCPDRPES